MAQKPIPTHGLNPPRGDRLVARATLAAAIIAALAAGYSAYLSSRTASAANDIARDELDRNTAQGLLNLAVDADFSDRDRKCEAVTALIEVERGAREEGKVLFVETYFNAMVDAGFYGLLCEEEIGPAPASTSSLIPDGAVAPDNFNNDETDFKIGQWHALIASYDITQRGCAFASEDIGHFARALAGGDFDGLPIYVARTSISKNYAVTVDTGDNIELARAMSRKIREVAQQENGPAGSGLDSFVQGNREWNIDPNCAVFDTIGD